MIDYVDTMMDYSESIIRISATALLIIVLMLISKKRNLKLEGILASSSLRGFVQLLLMASIILIIFELDSLLITALALMSMITVATHVSSKRSEGLPDNRNISFLSILSGSLIIIFKYLKNVVRAGCAGPFKVKN